MDVTATDAGVFVSSGADGGVTAQQIVPPELLKPSPAPYPDALRGSTVAGTVQLELLIDETGAVSEVSVAQGVHPALDQAAGEAARKLSFKPATLGGAPVPVRLRFSYEFLAPAPPPPEQLLGTLEGELRSRGTRDPIIDATLLEDGAVVGRTDEAGHFKLELPPGVHVLDVKAPGHDDGQMAEELKAGETVKVVYRLQPKQVDPYVTVIRDERPRAEVSRHTLSEQELHDVPGTMGDPFRVVMLLPGVSSLASGLSYPVVRGAQPAATGFFIDGIQVPFLYHMGVGSAVVHPDFIRQIDFYPSTSPVRYGRLLGGVIDGQITRPRDDRIRVSASADLINAGALVEAPFLKTGTSVTLAGRFSYTGWLATRIGDAVTPADQYASVPVLDFWDYQGRVVQKLPNGGRLRLLALGASDTFGSDQKRPDGFDAYARMSFHRIDLRYTQPLPLGELEASIGWGHDEIGMEGYQGLEQEDGSYKDTLLADYKLRTNLLNAKVAWTARLLPTVELTAGAELEHRRAANTLLVGVNTGREGDAESAFTAPRTLANLSAVHTEARWTPLAALTVTAGLRADAWHLFGYQTRFSLDPRLTARYALRDDLTLKAGASVVHQPPALLVNVPVLDIAFLRYGVQEAVNLEAGSEWSPLRGFDVSLDVYYSHLTRAVEMDLFQLVQNFRTQGLLAPRLGTWGRSYGVELMLRHPIGDNWFGWISYAFQHSTRYTSFIRFDEQSNPLERVSRELPFA